jgi:hypothetical protein
LGFDLASLLVVVVVVGFSFFGLVWFGLVGGD